MRALLEVLVLLAPAEGLVDLRRRDEGGEDGGVGAGVDRLHEGDVGEHRLALLVGVRASGMRETAPTVPLNGVRRVRPVKTRWSCFLPH